MTDDNYIDLHLHTTASDGSLTPEELIEEAAKLGFKAVAITDHDTVDGLEPGFKAAKQEGIELVPGVELNTDYKNTEVHVLGYYIDYEQPKFRSTLQELKAARRRRIEKMITKLNQMGVDLSLEEVLDLAGDSALGRVHIAQLLCEGNYVEEWEQAFKQYIGRSAPAYVEREKLTPKEAIELVQAAGGVPIIAHPGLIGDDSLLPQFIDWGAKGLEGYHTDHSPEDIERYQKFAAEHNLLLTGGSDCHGPHRKQGSLLGQIKVPYRLLEQLKREQ